MLGWSRDKQLHMEKSAREILPSLEEGAGLTVGSLGFPTTVSVTGAWGWGQAGKRLEQSLEGVNFQQRKWDRTWKGGDEEWPELFLWRGYDLDIWNSQKDLSLLSHVLIWGVTWEKWNGLQFPLPPYTQGRTCSLLRTNGNPVYLKALNIIHWEVPHDLLWLQIGSSK